MVVDPMPLMHRYLAGGESLSNDEREILLFALYMESLQRDDGIASVAMRKIGSPASEPKKGGETK